MNSNLLGNLCRHSAHCYPALLRQKILPRLLTRLSDPDKNTRKFACFAVVRFPTENHHPRPSQKALSDRLKCRIRHFNTDFINLMQNLSFVIQKSSL